ncbi:hypothetical protein CQ14_31510 [Bradyrhizobium lablabi]|uniref:Glycosyltransferase RgtA/B/C/D-like domain-containing protein n=1 Tax=Bradyrhizobium lablabi TaxID=722472 RepID=A0A0R3MBK9_9BRAD|nr:hypothetical protein [Bradyrhizobium lablabi]KRR17449.1 hypothetical protein CQ14_31510 [Bradyrhizobium lablabi]
MKIFRLLCGIGLLAVLASNVWTMSRWSESRGVYDDVCYLRQAHLFQKHGLGGIDTNIIFDDDDYLKNKLKAIGYAEWNVVARIPCHTFIPAADKYVMQYPPGTGFALALFREGFQVIPLYLLANATILAFALLALFRARDQASLALAAIFGFAALYLMINPSKASYSVPPTMMVCAAAGFLTARYFVEGLQRKLLLIALVGLLIGLSVNFRLPNLLLAAGYCFYLAGAFLLARSRETFLQGASFGIAFLIGMAPTLIANAINAGSPFSTTYGGVDVAPPELNAGVLLSYLVDVQFTLLAISAAWTAWLWRFDQGRCRQIALLVAVNLAVNLIFFMTHPIFTPYYIIPIEMISLWTLLFATLDLRGERAADRAAFPQPASA